MIGIRKIGINTHIFGAGGGATGTDWVNNPYLYFPPTSDNEGIPIVSGETSVLYGKSLASLDLSVETFSVAYTCDIGSGDGLDFTVTPDDGDIGVHELTIVLKNNSVEYTRIVTTIKVYEKVNAGEKTILCFGDSVMYNYFNKEMDSLVGVFDSATITTVGTKTNHSGEGYLHDAVSGYHYAAFAGFGSSVFTKDGSLDIPAYFTDNSLATPDIVYMRCGINDINAFTGGTMTEADITTIRGNIELLVDAFLAFDANLKVVIGLHNLPNLSADTWDTDYPATAGKGGIFVENSHWFQQRLVENYRNAQYNARVYVSYETTNHDRTNTTNIHTTAAGSTQLGLGFANTFAKLHQWGPELLDNPEFDATGLWSLAANWSITGGEAICNQPDTSGRNIIQANVVTQGSYYKLTYVVTAAFEYAAVTALYIPSTAAATVYLNETIGTHVTVFKVTQAVTSLYIAGKGYGKLGSVSLKKLL